MKIDFDETKHEYKTGTIVLPSVTQILVDCGIVKPGNYKAGAAERGSDIHATLALLDEEIITLDCVRPEFQPYAKAYTDFFKQTGAKLVETELRVGSEKLMFAGTLDRVIQLKNRTMIIDLKTGIKEKWHSLQLTGYLIAYCEMTGKKPEEIDLGDLYIDKEGKFKFVSCRPEITVWTACVQVHRWKNR